MRLNQIFLKSRHHAKAAQNENKVPFKELKTLKLQNKVTGSAKNNRDDQCLYELSLLFKCWNEKDFQNKGCDQYVQALQKCYKNYLNNMKQQKALQKSEVLIGGSKHLTDKQRTYLLQQYPTV